MSAVIWAGCGTAFTFLMTTLGAALVFFFKGQIDDRVQCACMGFASGVMSAAAVFSLLVPAIEQAGAQGAAGARAAGAHGAAGRAGPPTKTRYYLCA